MLANDLSNLTHECSMFYEIGEAKSGKTTLLFAEEFSRASVAQIVLCDFEPVLRRLHDFETFPGCLVFFMRDEDTVRLMGAASDPSSQLMELGESKAFGILNEHDRRVGHIDPDFDDGGGNEDLDLLLAECLHFLSAAVSVDLAVEVINLQIRKAFFDRCELGFQRFELGLIVVILDSRVNDIGLAAFADFTMYEGPNSIQSLKARTYVVTLPRPAGSSSMMECSRSP